MDSPTDERLLRDYLAGDEASFELLVRRHSRELFEFLSRFTGSSTVAEDIIQSTMLKVHTSAAKFDFSKRFKPWVFAVAANAARDYLRIRERRREVSIDAVMAMDHESGAEKRFTQLFSAEPADPLDELCQEENRRLVRRIISEMPVPLREILILAYYHRFTYKEIEKIVGVRVGTVKSRLHLAIVYFADRYRAAVRDPLQRDN